ncbi:unnamed protein product [Trichobilharzia szidati]|nr:unnamed protein product [Trichobilharzia szidati]
MDDNSKIIDEEVINEETQKKHVRVDETSTHQQIDRNQWRSDNTNNNNNNESEKLKSFLKQMLGLDPNATTTRPILTEEQQMRLSSVTLEMLMEREEIDIHPYGRGGIYEGILYKSRAEEQLDFTAAFIWFIFVSSVIMMSGSIVFVSELYHFLQSETTYDDRQASCDFFKNCGKSKSFH